MSKLRSMRWIVLVAALTLGAVHSAWAATASDSDSVTVTVAPVLSIADVEVGNFTLAFDNTTGSSTNAISTGQTVGYAVKSNNMPNAALPGALTAKISGLLNNIEILGFTAADGYVNEGAAGNAILEPVNTSEASPTVIGTTAVNMYNKPSSVGTAGKFLQGRAFIHYRAKALSDLVPGDGGTVTVTVTLKDA